MKKLKVWQKLFVLGLVFLLPFAVVTFSLISSVNKTEIEFAELEINGVDYIAPVRGLLKEVQLHRAYAAAYLNDDAAFKGRFNAQQAAVEGALTAVDDVEGKIGPMFDTARKWQGVRAECQGLFVAQSLQPASATANSQSNAPELALVQKSIEQHGKVIDNLVAFIKHIGDVSKLTLDPDLDSYYLMNILVFTGPDLDGLLGKARTSGLTVATTRRRPTTEWRTSTQFREITRLHANAGYVLAAVEDALEKSFSANPSLKQPQLVTARSNSHADTTSFLQAVANLLEGKSVRASAADYATVSSSAINSVFQLQEDISPVLRRLLVERQKNSRSKVMRTLLWSLLGLVFVSLIGVLIVRDITQPLTELMRAAQQIAAGNLSTRLSTDNRTDELGVLTTTFNHMLGSLQKLAGAAGQIAGGDLTARVQAQSEQDVLGNAFSTMSQNIHSMVGDLTTAVGVLGSSASEIVASTSQLAAGATETATAVSETTTTVEEIRQTAEVSNQKARYVAENAQKLAHISQSGKKAAEDSRQGMNRIRQQMGSIADSMVELSEQSQAIGAIIATVDDLTQQSNLLAVNAAIEAAKAGEQGKGFAVVAQEVKSLAEQSRQATAQVRTILSDIQKATSAAVMATEQGSKAVESGVQQAGLAGESIVMLTENVTEAAQAATQIAASSQQQLVGMEQMVLAMESIKQASTQNVDSARQLETSARDLGELGQQLRQLVEHYKV